MSQHTTTNLQRLLGRRALLTVDKLIVLVDVLDSRQCWDRVDCLVSPVAGKGKQWVSVERLREPGALGTAIVEWEDERGNPSTTALARTGGEVPA